MPMRPFFFLFFLLVWGSCSTAKKSEEQSGRGTADEPEKLVVLQLNIWQEGTMVPGGFEAIVNEIAKSKAGFVMLSEVRNYNGVDFTAKLVQALRQKGVVYYSFRSDDSGLLSQYPITEHEAVYPLANDRGSIYKLVTQVGRQRVAVYTAHLDYTHYACYLPRGYDGVSWKKLPHPVTDTALIKQMNLASFRDEAIEKFLDNAKSEIANGALIFLGGDFNEPSHLDWTAATQNLYDHRGVVYPWDVSVRLQKAGFSDAFRRLHPSAVSHPGFTYPSDNEAAKLSSLTWAPAADERERIDFIYYYPDKKLALQQVQLVGSNRSIIRGERKEEQSEDAFVRPSGTWPSDHKGVMATFELK